MQEDLYAEAPVVFRLRALKKWKSKLLRWANIIICVVRLMCGIILLLFSMIYTFQMIDWRYGIFYIRLRLNLWRRSLIASHYDINSWYFDLIQHYSLVCCLYVNILCCNVVKMNNGRLIIALFQPYDGNMSYTLDFLISTLLTLCLIRLKRYL